MRCEDSYEDSWVSQKGYLGYGSPQLTNGKKIHGGWDVYRITKWRCRDHGETKETQENVGHISKKLSQKSRLPPREKVRMRGIVSVTRTAILSHTGRGGQGRCFEIVS